MTAPRRILVVDDDPTNAKLLCDLLAAEGYAVSAARSGEEALAQDPPDLMLLDVVMPGMSGYDVCRAVRANSRTAILPVVMVTAVDPAVERIRGLDAGADDFLAKPVDPDELLARVRSLLRIKTLYDRLETQAGELERLNRTLEERVQAQLGQLERLARLKRFFSPALADLIVAGDAADPLQTHRAEVTVVYVGLRGFTAFAESAPPEEVMAVLREYHAEMGRLILAFAGTVERLTGDAIVVVFNDPVPAADAAERAVRLAVAMREACTASLEARWRARGYDLDFVVGIAQGYATLGAIGFEGRLEYGVVGVVTDLAAALCATASPGQILVTRRVLGPVAELLDVEHVGSLALAGFSRPVDAYDVVATRTQGIPPQSAGQDAGFARGFPAQGAGSGSEENIFRRDGEFWTIAYQGRSFRLRTSRGLAYIAFLLSQPGRRIPAVELAAVGVEVAGQRRLASGELRDSGLRIADPGDAGEVIDATARASYRRRLADLNEELEAARAFDDQGRAAKLQEELEFILQELTSAVGLGGRVRRTGSAAERARLNVTRAIRSAIERIGAHHRPLARYLSTTIETGSTCAYETEFRRALSWVL
jgi:class 3 adenylate cyclase/CheY-like chemotaxis protein